MDPETWQLEPMDYIDPYVLIQLENMEMVKRANDRDPDEYL